MLSLKKDEEALVAFLSGINQMFLAYLFLAITWSVGLEGHGPSHEVVPEDYDFELESGLLKGVKHTTSITCMAILSAMALLWVVCARLVRNRRNDFTHIGIRGH